MSRQEWKTGAVEKYLHETRASSPPCGSAFTRATQIRLLITYNLLALENSVLCDYDQSSWLLLVNVKSQAIRNETYVSDVKMIYVSCARPPHGARFPALVW